jgi:aminoglycoside phosphotransferase family enzyme/predicted kinase
VNHKTQSESLLEALLNPQFYPDRPSRIEYLQTHISMIFLTSKYVYKVKKPVDLGFVDYTTLEKRHYFCNQELELNRRLSPEIYLEVIPIKENNGIIHLDGDGEIIDYTLKMKQLPRDKMLDYLLIHGNVTSEMIIQVAGKMAEFHSKARTDSRIASFGNGQAISVNIEENRSQTEKYVDVAITSTQFHRINEFNSRFMNENRALLQERVASGKIKDCHGDLHAQHICFYNGIQVYDCIEFNDRFRYCDVASEIAFLAMDLERYHKIDLSRAFVEAYIKISKDDEIKKLINFYKCYRAYVRGKVDCFRLEDSLIKDKEAVLDSAKNYFNLAFGYTLDKPLLIIFSGLMGTGKSTLAEALSKETGFTVISSDINRKKLAGVSPEERRFEKFDAGIYSPQSTMSTYESLFLSAGEQLAGGQSLILDASFKKKEMRKKTIEIAEEYNADIFIVECVLDEAEARRRLDKRVLEGSVSDGRWEIFETQKRDFDKITEFPKRRHLVIDTYAPLSVLIKEIMEGVF